MDRRRFHASDDVERDGLVRIATEAAHLKIPIVRIQRIADRWRWLRRDLAAPACVYSKLGRRAGRPPCGRSLASLRHGPNSRRSFPATTCPFRKDGLHAGFIASPWGLAAK